MPGRLYTEIRENADGTVDLLGVEILSEGGPVHGIGSPPEGDYWSPEDLAAIAAANRELANEVKGPNKLGHSDLQALLQNSGLKAVTPGEMPAVGWLDGSTFEVAKRDGVSKLLADIRNVPAKVADLIEKKAYRTRSVELSRVESQELRDDAGKAKVFDWVVTGLAWLGAKMPAVRTLDDIVALYEEQHLAAPEARVFVVYAAGDVVWDPEAGFQDLRDDIAEALNGAPTGGMNEPRFWVADVSLTGDKALVQDYYDDGTDGWVVPFTRADDDTITIAPSSDWTQVEQGWVEAARGLEERALTLRRARADIRRSVPENTYTDEQRRTFAEATGLEADKVTDEMLAAAGVAAETDEPPARDLEADERFRSLEQRLEDESAARRKLEDERKLEQRDAFVEGVLRDGLDHPGQREQIEKLYETSPTLAREFYANRTPNDQWAREYGTDDEELTDEQVEASEKSYEADAESRLGLARVI